MRTTKLLTNLLLLFWGIGGTVFAQCSLITKNGSAQDPKTVCSPVDFTMNVWYKFLIPVDTNLVQIRFVWNDGTPATTTVLGHWDSGMDSVWAEASHIYPPSNECSRTAESFLIYDGDVCTSSGHQEQTFSTWGTDEENGGVLTTDPVVAYFCEGEDIVNVTFDDASTFNCNINIEPDNPNRYFRWVQFIYNTYTQGGDRIPNVTVVDNTSVTHAMTDGAGNFVSSFAGPIIQIPIPADGPNQTSFPISAPAGGIAGDIFEITMRNWNVCNPFDNLPTNGIPPTDLIDGDNDPIETTARIEIIAPPPLVVSNLFEFCTSENIVLAASAGVGNVRWYADSALTILLHTGNTFNPTLPPFNLNNTIPGSYTFYVTSTDGRCESAPSIVHLILYQSPGVVDAGPNQVICADSAFILATVPTAGSGVWTTTGSATIDNPTSPSTWVRNLTQGANTFQWTVTNGPCGVSDQVMIVSDRQPNPANAGINDSVCGTNSIVLNANTPNLNGAGYWIVLQGAGNVADSLAANTLYQSPSIGINRLLWRISSQYGACPVTRDTVEFLVDLTPGIANAGPDLNFCEITSLPMNATPALNGGTGNWTILAGTSILSNPNDPITLVNTISAGINQYEWNLHSMYSTCPSSKDTVTFMRDLSPGIANAGTDQTWCLENSDTLQGNTPLFGTALWTVISNPSGSAPVFSLSPNQPDAVFSVLPGNEGLYKLLWTFTNGTCFSRDTVIIDFGIPPPPANAGKDSSICGNSIQLQGNTIAHGQGTWTQISGPDIASITPSIHNANATVTITTGNEGIYAFEWRLVSGSCLATRDTVALEFLPFPGIPVGIDNASCGPDSILLITSATGLNTIIQWRHALSDPLPFFTGEQYTTPVLGSTLSFFINSIDTLSGCFSSKIPITASVYAIPARPVLMGDTICGAGNVIVKGIVIPPAQTIHWTIDKLGVIDIGVGLSISRYIITDTLFWARAIDTTTNCLSMPDSVGAIVHPTVPSPIAKDDSSCGPSDFVLQVKKTYTSNSILWFVDGTTAFPTAIADSLLLPLADSTRIFWIAEKNDSTGCISLRIPIEAKINPLPEQPILNDTSSCSASVFNLKPKMGLHTNSLKWYNLPVGGSLLAVSDSFQTGLLTSGKSYWVSGYNTITQCEGTREQIDISIYPLPSPITISGPTVVLKNQTGVIFATNGMAGSAYYWSIPAGIITDMNMNDFVRLSFPNLGSYDFEVYEITSHGCIGNPVQHPVTVINDSIAVDIGTYNQNACTAVDYEIKPYLFGGTPPYSYYWTGATTYLSNTNALFTTFSPPGIGSYKLYLQVVDINLKTAFDSVLISVFESPTANIITKDEIVCVGNSLQIRVGTTGYAAISHLWSGPIQDLSAYTEKEPVYTPHQPDTSIFRYTLTDIHGCKAYDTTRLYADIPIAYFEIPTKPGCSPLLVEFDNLSQRASFNVWNFGDGTTSNSIEPTHQYINQSSEIKYYPVTLEVMSGLGCKDQITQYAMVWPNPVATLDAIIETSCSPAIIRLFTTPANTRYYWSFGDGETETTTSFNTSHLFSALGFSDTNYVVKVITESSLICIDSAYLNVNVYARPDADFSISPPVDTFPDRAFDLKNLTPGDRWQHQWEFGNGKKLENTKEPGTIEYEAPGNYSVTLVASSSHCSDSMSKTVYLYPAAPMAKFAGADPGCMPHTVNLINYSEYSDTYLWEFGDGSISTAPNPSYTYYQPGTYKIKLTVKGAGGESSATDTTSVYILPNSFFDLAPRYVYVNDAPVNFFNLSDNADRFEWDFGDGEISEELNPKHVYKDEGTYDITLKVWTKNNCFDLYVMENAVLAEPSGVVEFPNAFRPASPLEENRVFKPAIIDHVATYHLMIFNRWGEFIYESFDQEVGWDGQYKGETAKQDVYVWKVKGTYTDGRGYTKTGDVTLMY